MVRGWLLPGLPYLSHTSSLHPLASLSHPSSLLPSPTHHPSILSLPSPAHHPSFPLPHIISPSSRAGQAPREDLHIIASPFPPQDRPSPVCPIWAGQVPGDLVDSVYLRGGVWSHLWDPAAVQASVGITNCGDVQRLFTKCKCGMYM